MLRKLNVSAALAALALASCDGGGPTTNDVQQAAIERARSEIGLGSDVPLKATVWTGREADGEATYCGSVQRAENASQSVRPMRFAAHGSPVTFFIFEDAHAPEVQTSPGKFENWTAICSDTQAA